MEQIKNITKISMLASSRDNKIKINNIDYILKLNLRVGNVSEEQSNKFKKELENTKTSSYMNFSYMGRLSKINANGIEKIIISTRTSNFSTLIPIECIECLEKPINKAIEELDELMKKEASNG
jgi:hypothetical protein